MEERLAQLVPFSAIPMQVFAQTASQKIIK